MASAHFKSVDDYISAQSPQAQAALDAVRRVLHEAVPGGDEAISYNMPACNYAGQTVLYFAAWKRHYSLYPVNDEIIAALGSDLAPYKVEKATVRFPYSEAVPAGLIRRIAKLRAKEMTRRKDHLQRER